MLNDYSVAQCCSANTSSSVPKLAQNSAPPLQYLDVYREKVLKLFQALDSKNLMGVLTFLLL